MFYQILCLYLVPLGTTLYLSRKDKKRFAFMTFSFYSSTMIINVCSFLLLQRSLFGLLDFNIMYYIFYIIISIFLNCICYGIWKKIHNKKICIFMKSTALVLILLTNISIYFLWLLDNTGRMSFELFYINISSPVNTNVTGFYDKMSILVSIMIFTSISITYLILKSGLFSSIKLKKVNMLKQRNMIISALFILLCLGTVMYLPYYTFHLENAYSFFYSEDEFIEKNYIDPNTVTLSWPDKKRNLILVFAESFESTYFSKELGGMMDFNLLPNLTELMDEGVYFSDHENAFGGAISMPQATNTISGMATTLSGINYKRPPNTNYNDPSTTVPGSTILNDILKEQGYQLYYMLGTSLIDYNIGPYYEEHGDTITIGYEDKIESGELPPDYKVLWGFEDSKLYGFAKNDLTKLGNQKEPFMYTITTSDIHSPEGYTDPICQKPYDIPMQNSIACTDIMMNDFLRWIMAQPFYENTTLVVVGDHIAHSDELIDAIKPVEDRRVFNLFLNAASPLHENINKTRKFWAGDMYPTILSAMGVQIDGNRMALGANLFSQEPTLVELYGEQTMKTALDKNSNFYYENFSK